MKLLRFLKYLARIVLPYAAVLIVFTAAAFFIGWVQINSYGVYVFWLFITLVASFILLYAWLDFEQKDSK